MTTREIATMVLCAMLAELSQGTSAYALEADTLYAGTSNPGMVYAYMGGSTWEPVSDTLGYAVLDLIEYDNHLYAATMSASNSLPSVGSVWRYSQGNTWTLVTTDMDDEVCDLIEWNGNLYAGTAWWGGKMYLLNRTTDQFEFLDYADGWSGIRAMYVWKQPWIQLGDILFDKFGRYDGAVTHEDVELYDGSCVYDFASYDNALYAATFRGRVYRSEDGINWYVVKEHGDHTLWELESFQGYLYMGYNDGTLRRMTEHHMRTNVWTAPDGIISMLADDNDLLYFGTGGEAGAVYQSSPTGDGRVYKYHGSGTPELISGLLGAGVQCLCKTSPSMAASTLDAADVGQTSATLRGEVVNDLGQQCCYRFMYCKSGDVWVSATTWEGHAVSGECFSQTLTGLTPGARYYFWAEISNSFGRSGQGSGTATFTTLTDPVELYCPNGGECLRGGSVCEIEWRADPNVVKDVLVEYSLDGGTSWNPIVTLPNTAANHRHLWNIPTADSQQCLVCVSDTRDPNRNDVSDDLFSITTLLVPNVVGMTRADAESALAAVGLTVGAITHNYSDSAPLGTVLSQQPHAGTLALADMAVNLVTSLGAKASVPPVTRTESATNVGPDTATLNGRIVDDGGGACRYRFCYWKSGDPWVTSTAWVGYVTVGQGFSHVLTGLTPGSRYYFWAEARNSAGRSGMSSGMRILQSKSQ